jgi:uncharacterized protein YjbI with pentapeptide repeats
MKGADLHKATFYKAKLPYANLSGADLSEADIGEATLFEANLNKANLKGARLEGAFLSMVDFSKAVLTESSLRFSILNLANFYKANLQEANLSKADMQDANFERANLNGADLEYANLGGASLVKANLRNSFLNSASLKKANLHMADLTNANLIESKMITADLSSSELTGARLYGTSRDDWIIDGVKCDYVYWDREGKVRTPVDRDFEPGEFEALYKSLPKIEYHFENSFTPLDAILMDKIVQQISERHPEFELKLDSFHSRGTPRAVFTVLHKEVAEQASIEIKHDYERRLAAIEADRDRLERCFAMAIEQPRQVIGRLEMGDSIHGDQIKGTKGDAFIAKDQATVNIQKISNPAAKDLIEQIGKLIQSVNVPDEDKADASQQLSNMVKELEKPKSDKGRLKRFYDRMIDVVPKIAEKLPWDKIVEKLFLS